MRPSSTAANGEEGVLSGPVEDAEWIDGSPRPTRVTWIRELCRNVTATTRAEAGENRAFTSAVRVLSLSENRGVTDTWLVHNMTEKQSLFDVRSNVRSTIDYLNINFQHSRNLCLWATRGPICLEALRFIDPLDPKNLPPDYLESCFIFPPHAPRISQHKLLWSSRECLVTKLPPWFSRFYLTVLTRNSAFLRFLWSFVCVFLACRREIWGIAFFLHYLYTFL